ncbi:Gfo/Idh/MocA family oxidoreductase [Kribbella sp. NPDC051770]|uniref:Gfo/Idh/MocA family protein n=1 Tax=Kribbella sp. NPDC051770 TaxID=3155413 RepID=UPI003436CAF9
MITRAVRLGIVGLGAMGGRVLQIAQSHPDYEVVAAADLDPTVVERWAREFPAIHFTTDPAEVVAAEIDALYVATPPATHADLTVAAFAAGRAVFCEKPLAVSLADGQRMVEAVAGSGRAAAVNFALSDQPATRYLEEVLGAAGEIRAVEIRLAFPHWPRPFQASAAWLGERAQGGFIREVFSHFAYLTDRLIGPLTPVDLVLDHRGPGAEVAAFGLYRAGDVPVQVSGVIAGPTTYEWIVRGTERSYLLRDWTELFVAEGNEWERVGLPEERSGDASRLSLFAEAVRGNHPENLADFASAYRVQQAVEAWHTS